MPMALTAEKLGAQYSITREQCDEFALSSQTRWQNGEHFLLAISDTLVCWGSHV